MITPLSESLQRGTLTLFLGADFPQAVTGLPSRADLAHGLAERHGVTGTFSLAQVAQRVSRAGNRFDFTDYLRRELDTAGKPIPAFYRTLTAFAKAHPLPVLVTTAYDDFLERALRDAGIPFDRIVRGSDAAFARSDRLSLIKLYGDVQIPETLVVTEDDHYGLWRDRDKENLLDEVRSLLKKQTVLFLGYNLSDPDFHLLWREVLDKMGRFARTAYAVWPNLPDGEVNVWRDRMIQVLDADPWGLAGTLAPTVSDTPDLTTVPVSTIAIPTDEIRVHLQRIEDKLDQKAAEDRQVAERLLVALNENRVTRAEVADMVAELRDWTQAMQQSGIPLHAEMREVLDTLTEHKGSDYQYLQLAIPLIPGILSYNVELGSEHQVDLKAIWKRIKANWGKRVKGQGESDSGPTYLGINKAWAVLVGINQYSEPSIGSLKVCVDDVNAIQSILAQHYAATRLLTDATPEHLPTRANLLGELSLVAQMAAEDDLLLFYFSGHGMAQAGESYLLARDTRLAALKHTALAMKDIREIFEQSPAHAKVIVLDACHSGAAIGKAESTMTPEFIQRVFDEAEGMAVLASCKQGQQSWEWPEKGRSVFTYFLLEALTGKADLNGKGCVTVSDASRYVTDGVKAWAVQRGVLQTPTLQYTVVGDIILLRYQEPTD